ncbi:MAG TPA: alanine racemase, partial [Bacillota bacterium]|nr:alanine racemase [Bacillota bacterium]
ERSKHGLAQEELADFLAALRDFPRIKVEGLMTMAPYTEDPEETRPVFRRLKELQQEAEARGMALPHLSMGMSNDFTVAVEEGATIVRIGSSLFGGAP